MRNVEREEKNHSFETKSQRQMTTIHEQTKWSTDVEEFFPNSLDSVSFTVCIASFYFSIWPRRWSGRKSNVIKRNNNNNKIKTSSYLFVDSYAICSRPILTFNCDRCDFWRIRAGIFHSIKPTQKRQTHTIYGAVRLCYANSTDIKETAKFECKNE